MLLKLLKHEFKSTYKPYLIAYFAILAYSFLVLFLKGDYNWGSAIFSFFIAFAFIMYMVIFIFISLIISLGRKTYGDSAYLLISVPVRPRTIVISKIILNFIWTVLSIIVIISSFSIVLSYSDNVFDNLEMDLGIFLALNVASVNGFVSGPLIILMILNVITGLMFSFSIANLLTQGNKVIVVGPIIFILIITILRSLRIEIATILVKAGFNFEGSTLASLWIFTALFFIFFCVAIWVSIYHMKKNFELK